jgi:hypothetical protein
MSIPDELYSSRQEVVRTIIWTHLSAFLVETPGTAAILVAVTEGVNT